MQGFLRSRWPVEMAVLGEKLERKAGDLTRMEKLLLPIGIATTLYQAFQYPSRSVI